MKKAVCLISGGLDSCVTAHIAKNQGYQMYGLSFKYGQRHKKELKCAKDIGESVDVKDHIFFSLDLSQFGGSSLVDKTIEIEDNKLEDIGKTIPSTYVPARNTIFLSIALAYAEVIDANSIFIGVTTTDFSGYPDCRPEFIDSFQKMANLATKKGIEKKPVQIKTPLLYMSKADIIKEGVNLKAPFEKTWSCYKGKGKACGKCDSCKLRLKGFKEVGIEDPIKYE